MTITVHINDRASVKYRARKTALNNPSKVAKMMKGIIEAIVGDDSREHFIVMHLDSRNVIMSARVVSIGTLSASLVHPREVFRAAIVDNCAAIVVGHNHPSGDPAPSADDIIMTSKLKKAGDIIGIELLDHVIIGGDRHHSMREGGGL